MEQFIDDNRLILMEAAIVEPLRRSSKVELHATLVNAPLIYDPEGRQLLGRLYQSYIDIAHQFDLPIFVCTPTWRASRSRVEASEIDPRINIDAVHYMQALCRSPANRTTVIRVGGMIGCKSDAYRPDQAPSTMAAQHFHSWQIEQLVQGGVDFLIAETLPNVDEALGIAHSMAATGTPYIISFVISRDGCVLDGTPLCEAIACIDTQTRTKPLGFMVNCAYPTFINPNRQPAEIFNRLIGYQANASSLDHDVLDNAQTLEVDDLSEWGDLMLALHHRYGLHILGGCCGTNEHHLKYIAQRADKRPSAATRPA